MRWAQVRSDAHTDAHAATDVHAGQGRHSVVGVPHCGASYSRPIADTSRPRGGRRDAHPLADYCGVRPNFRADGRALCSAFSGAAPDRSSATHCRAQAACCPACSAGCG